MNVSAEGLRVRAVGLCIAATIAAILGCHTAAARNYLFENISDLPTDQAEVGLQKSTTVETSLF